MIASAAVLLNAHRIQVGTVSVSEVNDLAGQSLIEQNGKNSTAYSGYEPAVKLDAAYFNTSSGSGFLLVDSVEFQNGTQSRSFFVNTYEDIVLNLNQYNLTSKTEGGSYKGFNFNSTLFVQGSSYTLVAAGYSGSFAFFIYDSGVVLSNAMTLIHDEINAMTG